MMERSDEQQRIAYEAAQKIVVTWPMVAREAVPEKREEAMLLARDYQEAFETAQIIKRYREIVNFEFWRASCEAGITEDLLAAREATWRAERDFENARLQPARESFEEAFAAWRRVLDQFEILRKDQLTADDIKEVVERYRQVLDQLDEPFPSPFVLQDMLDNASRG
jgi:chemotaxis regulatin CheY-phosphate phosphatase CheZ